MNNEWINQITWNVHFCNFWLAQKHFEGRIYVWFVQHDIYLMPSTRPCTSVQFSSVSQSCLTLWDPINCSTPGLPIHHQLPEFTQTHAHQVGDASSHLILCRPLLLLSPIPPSIRVFSNESILCMRWSKYWSFSFSISPSKEHPGLISFRMAGSK